jgi:hypothetical protein
LALRQNSLQRSCDHLVVYTSKRSFIENFQEVIQMTIKSALSVAALTVALTGAAFAQGMTMNGAPVSESDMPAVQERCDQLSNADATQSLTDTTSDAADTASDANDSNASNDAVLENAPATNQVASMVASSLNNRSLIAVKWHPAALGAFFIPSGVCVHPAGRDRSPALCA